jgi:hypothetical protein
VVFTVLTQLFNRTQKVPLHLLRPPSQVFTEACNSLEWLYHLGENVLIVLALAVLTRGTTQHHLQVRHAWTSKCWEYRATRATDLNIGPFTNN